MPKRKADATADPDRLVRQAAGTYRTADDRFEVRSDSGGGWFLVDTAQTNDFGQELIRGPFATLAAVRDAIPPARSEKVTPIDPGRGRAAKPRKASGSAKRGASRAQSPAKPPPPPPPPSWIDRLPAGEAKRARALIAALEREGIADAEALVRRDVEGLGPEIAIRLIEGRLEAIVQELPERGRPGARELLRRAAEILSTGGRGVREPLPGWRLVEVRHGDEEPEQRQITVRELPG